MACNNWFNCTDEKRKNLGWWQAFQLLFTGVGADDCPALRVSGEFASPSSPVKGYFESITDTNAKELLPATGEGLKYYITSILVTNASTTAGTLVRIIEEGGVILWTGYASTSGGFSCSLPTPITHATANKKIQAICVTTGASVTVSISGYKAP